MPVNLTSQEARIMTNTAAPDIIAQRHTIVVHQCIADEDDRKTPSTNNETDLSSSTYVTLLSEKHAPQLTEPTANISLSTTAVSCQSQHTALISFLDIPEWYQDNPDIYHGYRPVSNSMEACFRSLFYLHNETINIVSHLIPSLLLIPLTIYMMIYIGNIYPHGDIVDRLVFASFFFSAMVCFSLSALFHTVMNHSEGVCNRFQHLDFVGILTYNQGLALSGLYFIFYHEEILQSTYIAVIFSLGVLGVFAVLNPRFQGVKWRNFRLSVFLTAGLSPVVPVTHAFVIHGFQRMVELGVGFYFGEAGFFLLGAAFYGARCPESLKRFRRGKFDIFGASH